MLIGKEKKGLYRDKVNQEAKLSWMQIWCENSRDKYDESNA